MRFYLQKHQKKISSPRTTFGRIWWSKGFVLFLGVGMSAMILSVTRETINRIDTLSEIQKVESQVQILEKRNQELRNVIAYESTSSFQEREARMKLGLQKSGEHVIIFPDTQTKQLILPRQDEIDYQPIEPQFSNPQRWFDFFYEKLTTS